MHSPAFPAQRHVWRLHGALLLFPGNRDSSPECSFFPVAPGNMPAAYNRDRREKRIFEEQEALRKPHARPEPEQISLQKYMEEAVRRRLAVRREHLLQYGIQSNIAMDEELGFLQIGGIRCRIVRSSARKRPVLKAATGGADLLVPPEFTLSAAQKLLQENPSALRRVQKKAAALPPPAAPPDCSIGGTLRLFGRNCPVERGTGHALYSGGVFHVHPVYARPDEFLKLYKKLAFRILSAKAAETAARAGVTVQQIRIGSAAGRWGSCSADGHLNFPWKLVLCPEKTVDYVVAHEIAHRKHMDHSPAFWEEVARLCPEWKLRRKELRFEEQRLRSWDDFC